MEVSFWSDVISIWVSSVSSGNRLSLRRSPSKQPGNSERIQKALMVRTAEPPNDSARPRIIELRIGQRSVIQREWQSTHEYITMTDEILQGIVGTSQRPSKLHLSNRACWRSVVKFKTVTTSPAALRWPTTAIDLYCCRTVVLHILPDVRVCWILLQRCRKRKRTVTRRGGSSSLYKSVDRNEWGRCRSCAVQVLRETPKRSMPILALVDDNSTIPLQLFDDSFGPSDEDEKKAR